MSTPLHRLIPLLHSSPKKSSNSIHSLNRSDWFLNHPTLRIICTKGDDGEVIVIELIRKNDDSSKGEPEEEGSTTTEGVGAEYFDIFPTKEVWCMWEKAYIDQLPSNHHDPNDVKLESEAENFDLGKTRIDGVEISRKDQGKYSLRRNFNLYRNSS
ncbi:hypothetical protein Tco_0659815 [Tanacetum coccineum]